MRITIPNYAKNLPSLLDDIRKGKKNKKKAQENILTQDYAVLVYQDHCINAFMLKQETSKRFNLHNSVKIQIQTAIIGSEKVDKPELLAEQLDDVLTMLEAKDNIPIILILEANGFSFVEIECEEDIDNVNDDEIEATCRQKIISASPFIETETIHRIINRAKSRDEPDNINILYANKIFLESWISTLEKIKRPVAFVGSKAGGFMHSLLKESKAGTLLLDLNDLGSRLYYYKANGNLIDFLFPYGIKQFMTNKSNVFDVSIFETRVKAMLRNNLPELDANKIELICCGLPDLLSSNLSARYKKLRSHEMFESNKISISECSNSLSAEAVDEDLIKCAALTIMQLE